MTDMFEIHRDDTNYAVNDNAAPNQKRGLVRLLLKNAHLVDPAR